MIKVLFWLLGLLVFGVLSFAAIAVYSHYKTPDIGLKDGRLLPCPQTPNCVCSESYAGKQPVHDIPPIRFNSGEGERLWALLKEAIVDDGGEVVEERADYLHALFSSAVFRFVDDLELRLDRQAGVIHIRSASRVGRSDLGVNRKRVEQIWQSLGEGR